MKRFVVVHELHCEFAGDADGVRFDEARGKEPEVLNFTINVEPKVLAVQMYPAAGSIELQSAIAASAGPRSHART